MSTWSARFKELAELVATWSKDPEAKVGAVLVSADRRVQGVGYNGLPQHVPDTDEILCSKHTKNALMVHAEVNAVHNSHGKLHAIYVTKPPCSDCAQVLVSAGVKEVHCPKPTESSSWFWSNKQALDHFKNAQIRVYFYDDDTETTGPI